MRGSAVGQAAEGWRIPRTRATYVGVLSSSMLLNLVDGVVAGEDAGVAVAEDLHGGALEFGGHRGAAIVDHRDEIAEVASVADRGLDAFVGVDAGDVDGGDAEILQNEVEVRSGEDAAGRLVDDDLVALRPDGFEKIGFAGAGAGQDAETLVAFGAVATVGGEGLDADVDDLEFGTAEGVLEPAEARDNAAFEGGEIVFLVFQRDSGRGGVAKDAVAAGGVQVLHIDAEQRGLLPGEHPVVGRILLAKRSLVEIEEGVAGGFFGDLHGEYECGPKTFRINLWRSIRAQCGGGRWRRPRRLASWSTPPGNGFGRRARGRRSSRRGRSRPGAENRAPRHWA